MDLKNLKNNYELLLSHMKKENYSHSQIGKISTELNRIFKYAKDTESYLEYYNRVIKPLGKEGERNYRLEVLNVIMNFDLYNILPDKERVKYRIINKSNYYKLCNEFKSIIDIYTREAKKTDKKEMTIYHEALNGTSFLLHLQERKIETVKDITEKDAISFFLNDENQLIRNYSYRKNIRAVFKACMPFIEDAERIMNYLPILRRKRKNIQYLKQDEIISIKKVLNDSNSNISLRNKAIVTLLLYTGLRGCDIYNLKLDNIDWENEIIHIIQSKTNVSLELPLTKTVGNSICNYILYERPKVNISNVFIKEKVNHPIGRSSIELAIRKVMDEANVRMNAGERRGSHIFRHNVAITLLEHEVAQPIITETLGHTSPKTLEIYLNADISHLKQCALSIEDFPYMEVQA